MFERNCCNRQNEFNTNFNADTMNVDVDMDFSTMPATNMPMMGGPMMSGTTQSPIVEAGQERQVHRTIVHEVPQV